MIIVRVELWSAASGKVTEIACMSICNAQGDGLHRMTHPSHKTRFSDASSFDEICTECGATDMVCPGPLDQPCPKAEGLIAFTPETQHATAPGPVLLDDKALSDIDATLMAFRHGAWEGEIHAQHLAGIWLTNRGYAMISETLTQEMAEERAHRWQSKEPDRPMFYPFALIGIALVVGLVIGALL